jgi:hypothetical protein
MTKTREKPLHLDMSFDEALKRFAQTDPRQIPAESNKKKKRKTPRPTDAKRAEVQEGQRSTPPHK